MKKHILLVAAGCWLSAASAAEFLIDTSIACAPASGEQSLPGVAFDGTNFLVVWADLRGGSTVDIYGARVSQAGQVLDPSGIAISTAAGGQGYPAVAFDGTNFLVAWDDSRGSSIDIYCARVNPAGHVLDSSGIAVSTAAGYQLSPAVAFDGTDFLVAWSDYRSVSTSDIYGARVRPAGQVLDSGPVVRQEGNQLSTALARGGAHQMLLVYQGWTGTVGGKIYNTPCRIWGKINPRPGVQESRRPAALSPQPLATIVRGMLQLGLSAVGREQSAALFDASGRKVLSLHSGANDVSRLSPGVYFVRCEPQASGLKPQAQAVRKVILTN